MVAGANNGKLAHKPDQLHEGSSLRIVEVTKEFAAADESAGRMTALRNVNLSIAPGELVVIVLTDSGPCVVTL